MQDDIVKYGSFSTNKGYGFVLVFELNNYRYFGEEFGVKATRYYFVSKSKGYIHLINEMIEECGVNVIKLWVNYV